MIAWFDFYIYANLWICYLLIQETNSAMRLNEALREFFWKRLENLFVKNHKIKQCDVTLLLTS